MEQSRIDGVLFASCVTIMQDLCRNMLLLAGSGAATISHDEDVIQWIISMVWCRSVHYLTRHTNHISSQQWQALL